MKTIFFIDGENFVYQLRDSLASRKLIRYRDELSRVNIRKLFENVLQDPSVRAASIRYYASKIHIIDKTPELKERTERYATDAAAWQKVLEAQKVEYIEAGHLLVRDGKPCVECGHREPVLVEKGVDVTIATDMIRSSGDNVRLVLLSSDGDLMPAVLESKRRGAELVYIGFRGVSNAALARTADKRFTITSKHAAAVLAPAPKKDQPAEPKKLHLDQPKTTHIGHHRNQSKSAPSVFTGSRLASMLPTLPSQAIDKTAKQPKPKTVSKKKKPEDKQ
jgi:uncharacterized LabA/DUF88 family protein